MIPATVDESTPPDIATTTVVSFGSLFKPIEFFLLLIDGIYTDFYYKVHKMILEFEPGDKVINPLNKDWGIGQVQSIINNKITVNFENAGKKVINAENIVLEKFKSDDY